jgi:hypothetical protein
MDIHLDWLSAFIGMLAGFALFGVTTLLRWKDGGGR